MPLPTQQTMSIKRYPPWVLLLVAVLTMLACQGEDEPDDPPPAAPDTPEALLEHVQAALSRPGEVAHIHADYVFDQDRQRSVHGTMEAWYDESGAARVAVDLEPSADGSESAPDELTILDQEYVYRSHPRTGGEATRSVLTRTSFCSLSPGFATVTAAPLMCAFTPPAIQAAPIRLDGERDLDGRTVLSIAYEEAPGTLSPYPGVHRFLVDPATYLPVAYTFEPQNPARSGATARYEVTFVPRDSLPADYFDPASIGYQAPLAGTAADPSVARLLQEAEIQGVPVIDIIGSGWTVGTLTPWRDASGRTIGFFGDLELAEPISGDGPWRYLACGDTQYVEYKEQYRDVERLLLVVDVGSTRLFELGPMAENIGLPGASGIRESDLPFPVGEYIVYDRESGDEIETFDLDGTDLKDAEKEVCEESAQGGR